MKLHLFATNAIPTWDLRYEFIHDHIWRISQNNHFWRVNWNWREIPDSSQTDNLNVKSTGLGRSFKVKIALICDKRNFDVGLAFD